MSRGMPEAPKWAWAVMISGLIAIIVMLPIALKRGVVSESSAGEPAAAAGTSGSPSAPEPVRILVIGDGYTAEASDDAPAEARWPGLVAADLRSDRSDVVVDVATATGGGYVRPGASDATFVTLAERAAKGYGLVVFFGARNDTGPRTVIEAAAARAYASIEKSSPEARLLVIGPAWAGDPPSSVLVARQAVAAAAKAADAVFVDPLEEDWFPAESSPLVSALGAYPTREGHRHIAGLLLPRIRAEVEAVRADARPGR